MWKFSDLELRFTPQRLIAEAVKITKNHSVNRIEGQLTSLWKAVLDKPRVGNPNPTIVHLNQPYTTIIAYPHRRMGSPNDDKEESSPVNQTFGRELETAKHLRTRNERRFDRPTNKQIVSDCVQITSAFRTDEPVCLASYLHATPARHIEATSSGISKLIFKPRRTLNMAAINVHTLKQASQKAALTTILDLLTVDVSLSFASAPDVSSSNVREKPQNPEGILYLSILSINVQIDCSPDTMRPLGPLENPVTRAELNWTRSKRTVASEFFSYVLTAGCLYAATTSEIAQFYCSHGVNQQRLSRGTKLILSPSIT
ncbi:hypothetical protein T265_07005 [Opisthorchis viverrini]|uniref:Uncharacterized protein n=1 Tax=Opisthorchis viverrini TaxID=6198 RepID=A0A074ZE46_OPIVI|nr:hypothetical protein T265_07005 [Opisthorchis viverrini]KER25546.1 hypothetical protein T265_07005 [Opisthorchis viverrini]